MMDELNLKLRARAVKQACFNTIFTKMLYIIHIPRDIIKIENNVEQ